MANRAPLLVSGIGEKGRIWELIGVNIMELSDEQVEGIIPPHHGFYWGTDCLDRSHGRLDKLVP